MLGYLAAKAADYRILIELLKHNLSELPDLRQSHPVLSAELEAKIAQLGTGCRRLEQIVTLGVPSLAPFGVAALHTMELDLVTLSYFYLPAARNEGALERRYRVLTVPVPKLQALGSGATFGLLECT